MKSIEVEANLQNTRTLTLTLKQLKMKIQPHNLQMCLKCFFLNRNVNQIPKTAMINI